MNNKLPFVVIGLVLVGIVVYYAKTSTPVGAVAAPKEKEKIVWTAPVEPPVPKKEEEKKIEPPKEFYGYAEGLELAKKENKHVFLLFHADWCGWCKKLEADTLSKPEIKERLKNYVVVHVDTDKEPDLATTHRVTGLPAYFMLAPDGQTVKTGVGYKNISDFKTWLSLAAIRED